MVRLFNHWFPSRTVLQVAFDAVLLFVIFLLAAAWLTRGALPGLELLPSALVFAIAMIVLNSAVGLYRRDPYRTGAQTAARISVSVLLTIPVAYGVVNLQPWTETDQDAIKLAAIFALAGLVATHSFASRRKQLFARRILVFGTGKEAAAVEKSLRHFGPGMALVGFYPAGQTDEPAEVGTDSIFPRTMSLADTAAIHDVDDVIVALRERRGGALPLNQLLECKLAGTRVLDLSSYYERAFGQVRVDTLHASWLIFGEGFRQGAVRTAAKRVFDIVVSSGLLVIGLPVMAFTALLIVLESGFPILYRQERVGQAGRVFRVVKFRSMRADAENDGNPRWATTSDDRVTRVGRVLRKLRIDEMPQLVNVLKGDMSLVGPRPERPFFVDRLTREIPFYAARHSVKPGITGWAQIRYHYGASLEDAVQKLQYDLYYVKNHTLFLDVLILFETVGVVVTGKGAQ